MIIPTASDLAIFLNVPGPDTTWNARADQILGFAVDLCSSIVDPLPDAATGIVISVAARSFANPEMIASETVGPFTVQRPTPGLFLTRSEKAALRRMAGGTSAFSVDTLPKGVSAVQLITVTGSGGTFTLSFAGQVTVPIAYGASAATVQSALEALPSFGAGNVTVAGAGPYTVTWVNNLATTPIPLLVAAWELTGPGAGVVVANVTAGVFAPGQNLPYWDRGYVNEAGTPILGYPQ